MSILKYYQNDCTLYGWIISFYLTKVVNKKKEFGKIIILVYIEKILFMIGMK